MRENAAKAAVDSNALTLSKEIMPFAPTNGQPKFIKNVVLRIVGKTSAVKTKASKVIRVYLSNGTDVFQWAVWLDHFGKVLNALRCGNILRFSSLKVNKFYEKIADERHTTLWKDGELSLTQYSKVTVVEAGKLQKYPSDNLYPPYWNYLETIKPKDSEIAVQVLILDTPKKFTLGLKDGEETRKCIGKMFTVGDKKGKKASCFVEVNFEDPEDVADSEAWDVGDEMILFCGKAFDYQNKLAIFVESFEYLTEVDPREMNKDVNAAYEEVSFPMQIVAPISTVTLKKRRRTVFY